MHFKRQLTEPHAVPRASGADGVRWHGGKDGHQPPEQDVVQSLCSRYRFPIVAVTNFHKLGGLKQHTFILLRSRCQTSDTGLPGLQDQSSALASP